MNVKNNLTILSSVWKNKESILEGVKNRAFKKSHIEEIAKSRQEICSTCIWNSKQYNTYEDLPEVITTVKDRDWIEDCIFSEDDRCLHCSCNIDLRNSIKLRSLSSRCPLPEPKWKEITEDETIVDEIYKIAVENESGNN